MKAGQGMKMNNFDSNSSKRIRGNALSKIRQQYFSERPLCESCKNKMPPRITQATELDHIVALNNGGTDDPFNIFNNRQGLCKKCHDEKTKIDLNYKPAPKIGLDGFPVEKELNYGNEED